MILSKSANYALRAALHLAEEGEAGPVSVDEIAGRLGVPRNYLSKILHELARSQLLVSTRGPGGGFRLGMPAEEISFADVVRHFDEIPNENSCLLGRERCSATDPCRAHERWAAVRSELIDFLERTRLTDLSVDGASPDGTSDPGALAIPGDSK